VYVCVWRSICVYVCVWRSICARVERVEGADVGVLSSRVSHMDESCHTHFLGTHIDESCHIWMSHVTYGWVMSHMDVSLCRMSYVSQDARVLQHLKCSTWLVPRMTWSTWFVIQGHDSFIRETWLISIYMWAMTHMTCTIGDRFITSYQEDQSCPCITT